MAILQCEDISIEFCSTHLFNIVKKLEITKVTNVTRYVGLVFSEHVS